MLSLSSAISSTTTDAIIIASWSNMSTHINLYFSIFLFIFGVIGNILNILVLSQRSLRSNPCAWLFLISSLANFIALLSGLTTRIISNWTDDVTDIVPWLCKLRVFVLYTSRTIASWLIMLASIDRWLLSCLSARRRLLSSLERAHRGTIIIILCSLFLYSPIFYCYEANLLNAPLRCYSRTILCRIFADQVYTCITVVFPLMFMFLFGFMTMSNVRKLKLRLQSPLLPRMSNTVNPNDQRQRFRRIDRHLLIMLLVQISFLALFTLPQAIQQIYSTITRNKAKTSVQEKIESSIYSFGILLTYLASGMPFYIYTLSGGCVFRQAFFSLIRRMKQTILCQQK
ncbi:unnamed protein product [Rotaria sp. Silwood2]|nr:unnamed protein product [Rotaria sp. Silwood2]CAF2628310.1 unnamed protein product [Rotaria sp. Silwood2]CAF2838277.1 unnamed protein product [Rotaria sp. Silwood2]CAF3000782.1 unnamed protein product [Rotaria sp. Silwood2]CAF3926398.1 unnamed protein product [Rotaria sp. Silwood2]